MALLHCIFLLLVISFLGTNAAEKEASVIDCMDDAGMQNPHNDRFMSAPRKPGEISYLRWANGTIVDPYAVQIGVPPSLTATMQKYCDESGITDLYRSHLMDPEKELKPGNGKEIELGGFTWYLQRPELEWKSNMHWLSCNDERTSEKYASLLGQGGFDVVLEALGRFFDLDGLDCYSLGFIAVTHCEKGFMHTDFSGVNGKAFNILIPLELVEGSVPEFAVETHDDVETRVHYEYDVALVVGDNTMHGTGECDYRDMPGKMRMGVSIYLSDTNEENVEAIIGDYTDPFPPADEEYLLSRRGRHWKKDGSAQLPKEYVEPVSDQAPEVCEETPKPEWADYDRADFEYEFDCETVFSTERPILDKADWMILRKAYADVVGQEHLSISPLSTDSGFAVAFRAAQSQGRGRGVFASQVIRKGSLIWRNRQTARFPDVAHYRKFLMTIPNELVCDIMDWSYVQATGEDYDDMKLWKISTDLDEGALMNHGDLIDEPDSPKAFGKGRDIANVGCVPEAAVDLPGGCIGNIFALREIHPGEELLIDYGEIAIPSAWEEFGF